MLARKKGDKINDQTGLDGSVGKGNQSTCPSVRERAGSSQGRESRQSGWSALCSEVSWS